MPFEQGVLVRNGKVIGSGGGGNLVELEYGVSTYDEFLAAYQSKNIVYCKASSGTDPSVGNKVRKAFMAYVNDDTTPTEVEFQYYRSIANHTVLNQTDEVHIYKLNSTSGWSYLTRKISLTVAVANNGGLSRTVSGNACVLSVNNTVLRGPALAGFEETVGTACTNPNGYTVGSYFKGKDGYFYEVTAAISSGDTITVGTNCKQTDIATELSELNADIAYTEVATASGNQTYSAQGDYLYPYFASLTDAQKRRCGIVLGDNWILRISLIDGRFSATMLQPTTGTTIIGIRLLSSGSSFCTASISTSGVSAFSNDSSGTNNNSMKLVLLN